MAGGRWMAGRPHDPGGVGPGRGRWARRGTRDGTGAGSRLARRRAALAAVAAAAALVVPAGDGAGAAFRPTGVGDLPGPHQGTTQAVVALTFDDGPHPVWTPAVLDVLDRYGVPATFFPIGSLAERHPDIVRRVVAEGHALGNHTWSHRDLTRLPAGAWPGEVDRATRHLAALAGQPVTCLRPPFGATSAGVRSQLAARGLTEALWTHDTRDFRRPGVDVIVTEALRDLRPGSVILFHDGPGDRSQTVAALPRVIEGIRARGFRIVPVCGTAARGPERPAVAPFGPVGVGDRSAGVVSAGRLVGMAASPSGRGYWLAAADGGVFTYGDAAFHGSAGGLRLAAPVVGIAATPTGRGYRLAAADGGVFTYGDAAYRGGLGHVQLNAPIVGIASTPGGGGYWLVGADGGVFTYGDATFHGSLGHVRLAAPIVGVATTPTGRGYWLAAADGGVFTFGDARFHGSLGHVRLAAPIVGIAATPPGWREGSGGGYWLAGADGGVFTFGDAPFQGSRAGSGVSHRAIIPSPQGGYWLLGARPA